MIRYSLVLISSLLFSLAAEQVAFPEKGMTPDQSVQKDKATQPDFCFLEARAAYFYPTGHKFREVYSGAGVYGLEFDCRVVKYLYGWVGADYLGKSGKTSAGNSTKITIVPFSTGLKWLYTAHSVVQPYLGVGIETMYLRVKTDSASLIHSKASWGVGGRFKAGMLIRYVDYMFVDLFADYSLRSISLEGSSSRCLTVNRPDISGFSFGGGLGYFF